MYCSSIALRSVSQNPSDWLVFSLTDVLCNVIWPFFQGRAASVRILRYPFTPIQNARVRHRAFSFKDYLQVFKYNVHTSWLYAHTRQKWSYEFRVGVVWAGIILCICSLWCHEPFRFSIERQEFLQGILNTYDKYLRVTPNQSAPRSRVRLYNESMSRHVYDRDTKTQTSTVVLDLCSYYDPVMILLWIWAFF